MVALPIALAQTIWKNRLVLCLLANTGTKLLAKRLTESHWRLIFSRLKYVTHLNHISFLTKQSINCQQQKQENFVRLIR